MLLKLFLVVAVATIPSLASSSWTSPKSALVIIDVQDCFLSGGSLAVTNGDDVIPVINKIRDQFRDRFTVVALAFDWHPNGHVSFASSFPGKKDFETVDLSYSPKGDLCVPKNDTAFERQFPNAIQCDNQGSTKTRSFIQELWPDHCIQYVKTGPTSSKLSDKLRGDTKDHLIYKGTRKELDSYSAFYDNGDFDQTNLNSILKANGITHVFVTGLANDFCVYYTSLDALRLGYETYMVKDATRGVAPESVEKADLDMAKKGVHLIQSDYMAQVFYEMQSTATASRSSKLTWNLLAVTTAFIYSLVWTLG